jgi:hypothetical protein
VPIHNQGQASRYPDAQKAGQASSPEHNKNKLILVIAGSGQEFHFGVHLSEPAIPVHNKGLAELASIQDEHPEIKRVLHRRV